MSAHSQNFVSEKSLRAIACLLAGLDGLPAAAIGKLAKYQDMLALEFSELNACGFSGQQSQAIIDLLHDSGQMQKISDEMSSALLNGHLQAVDGALAYRLADAPRSPILVAANSHYRSETLDAPCVAIVGSRVASERALAWTRQLAMSLAEAGIVIVSGGAFGIDQAAHEGAIRAGGETLVVLGGTFAAEKEHLGDNFTPLWNQAQLITEQVRPGSIRAWMYPRRNRLVAAIASVVVVVEGGKKSGSLITADYARKMGRSLMAVPGWVEDEMSQAPNILLHRHEALLCRNVDDVLQVLGRPVSRLASQVHAEHTKAREQDFAQANLFSESPQKVKRKQKKSTKNQASKMQVTTLSKDDYALRIQNLGLSVLQQSALDYLHAHPGACHIDELATALEQPASLLASVFLQLELHGVVESLPGACYAYRK